MTESLHELSDNVITNEPNPPPNHGSIQSEHPKALFSPGIHPRFLSTTLVFHWNNLICILIATFLQFKVLVVLNFAYHIVRRLIKVISRFVEMVHLEKVLLVKTENLNLIPWIHLV